MTKKHYVLLANVLGRLRFLSSYSFDDDKDFRAILREFATALERDNPDFDRQKFYEAAEERAQTLMVRHIDQITS